MHILPYGLVGSIVTVTRQCVVTKYLKLPKFLLHWFEI